MVYQNEMGLHSNTPCQNKSILIAWGVTDIILETIPYTIRRSTRTKRLKIAVSAQGVEVIIPKRFAAYKVPAIIQKRKAWIEKHFAIFQSRPRPAIAEFSQGAPFLYQQKKLTLSIHQTNTLLAHCAEEGERLAVYLPVFCPEHHVKPLVKQTLQAWLNAQLLAQARTWIEQFEPAIGRTPHTLRIRTPKRQWGSCNSRGVICLHFSLIFAPPAVLAYVVAHEMAHLIHMNHSPDFWALVATLIPDYRVHRNWLRNHGELMQYFPE